MKKFVVKKQFSKKEMEQIQINRQDVNDIIIQPQVEDNVIWAWGLPHWVEGSMGPYNGIYQFIKELGTFEVAATTPDNVIHRLENDALEYPISSFGIYFIGKVKALFKRIPYHYMNRTTGEIFLNNLPEDLIKKNNRKEKIKNLLSVEKYEEIFSEVGSVSKRTNLSPVGVICEKIPGAFIKPEKIVGIWMSDRDYNFYKKALELSKKDQNYEKYIYYGKEIEKIKKLCNSYNIPINIIKE